MSLSAPGPGRLPGSCQDGKVAGGPAGDLPDPPGWPPQGDSSCPGQGARGRGRAGAWASPCVPGDTSYSRYSSSQSSGCKLRAFINRLKRIKSQEQTHEENLPKHFNHYPPHTHTHETALPAPDLPSPGPFITGACSPCPPASRPSAGQDAGARASPVQAGCRAVQPLWDTVWQLLHVLSSHPPV